MKRPKQLYNIDAMPSTKYEQELERYISYLEKCNKELFEASSIGLECLREIGDHEDGWEDNLEKVESIIDKNK